MSTYQQVHALELAQMELQIRIKDIQGISRIYPNQKEHADRITLNFGDDKRICMAIAPMQSGKTGTQVDTTYKMMKKYSISPSNVYIIAGVNSIEWEEQQKLRNPEILKNICHLQNINSIKSDIEDKEDILIVIDECQVACKSNQTLAKLFSSLEFTLASLTDRNIRIIQFSATPNGCLLDLSEFHEVAFQIYLEPDEGYIGLNTLKERRQLQQYFDISGKQSKNIYDQNQSLRQIRHLFNFITNRYVDDARYHLIRIPSGTASIVILNNFINQCDNRFTYITYDLAYEDDINDILKIKPSKPTIVFVKEKLRCAKTLDISNIGLLFDRYSNSPDDSVSSQSFAGRACGYQDSSHLTIFTNLESIERYIRLSNLEFENISNLEWRSNSTKYRNSQCVSKGTYNKAFNNLNSTTVQQNTAEVEPMIITAPTFKIIKEFYIKYLKDVFNGRGPNNRKPNTNGFYETTLGRRRGTGVYSYSEIYSVRKWGLNDTHKYTFHPCYDDTAITSTLKFCLIFYCPNTDLKEKIIENENGIAYNCNISS